MQREKSSVIAGLPDQYTGVQLWQAREQLDLTKSQKNQIETILKGAGEQNQPIQAKIEEIQDEVYSLIKKGHEELARQTAGSGESLHEERLKILAPACERIITQVLTHSQRQAFIQQREDAGAEHSSPRQ